MIACSLLYVLVSDECDSEPVASLSYLDGAVGDSGRAEALVEFVSAAFIHQLRHSFFSLDAGVIS